MIGVQISSDLLPQCESGHYQMAQEVQDWLEAKVGPGSQKGGWIDGSKWLWCWHGGNFQKAVVVFDDPETAMLFKLTWGGW